LDGEKGQGRLLRPSAADSPFHEDFSLDIIKAAD